MEHLNLLLQKIFRHAESLLFPEFCLACGDLCEAICLDCQHKIKIYPHARHLSGFKVYSGTWYQKDHVFAHLLHRWKYDPQQAYFRYLSGVILEAEKLLPACRDPVYVPIPIAESHYWKRRFNQSEMLAQALAHHRQGRYEALLQRTQDAPHQARMHRREDRMKNSQSSFTCPLTLDPQKEYIIVDDIVTSGATLYAAAYALWTQGAQTIYGLCLADRSKEF